MQNLYAFGCFGFIELPVKASESNEVCRTFGRTRGFDGYSQTCSWSTQLRRIKAPGVARIPTVPQPELDSPVSTLN